MGKRRNEAEVRRFNFRRRSSSDGHPDTALATFVPHTRTKSGSTNLPEGTVHVYRDSISKQRPPGEGSTASVSVPSVVEEGGEDVGDVMLGVLAVPAWMTPSDFLAFVAPAAEGMAHLRMIR
jgi:BRCA1-associated protein